MTLKTLKCKQVWKASPSNLLPSFKLELGLHGWPSQFSDAFFFEFIDQFFFFFLTDTVYYKRMYYNLCVCIISLPSQAVSILREMSVGYSSLKSQSQAESLPSTDQKLIKCQQNT